MPTKKQLVYDSIKVLPLKLFFEIAESGNIELLGAENNELTWEKINKEYGENDVSHDVSNYIDFKNELYDKTVLLIEIKAMLLYLIGADSAEYIDRLKSLGYSIDKENKIDGIKKVDKKSDHIKTEIKVLESEIAGYSKGKKASFDSTMVWLSSQLGFELNENITVLRFLEFKKMVYERNKKKRFNNR